MSDFLIDPTPDNPRYSMVPTGLEAGTRTFSINVDEGWRSWILCSGMYEWAAVELMERLHAAPAAWRHPGETETNQ